MDEVASDKGSPWLTPERAFRSTDQKPAIVQSSFPLLSIPAARQTQAPVPASDAGAKDLSITGHNVTERGAVDHSLAKPNVPKHGVATPIVTKQGSSNPIASEPTVTEQGIPAHSEPASKAPSNEAGVAEKVANIESPIAEEDAALSLEQAGAQSDADGAGPVRPFAGLEKLGESPPLAIENLPRLMFMTVLVLGTCLGTLLLGRRWLTRSGLAGKPKRHARLQIVASLSVAPRSYLHVVRLDDREVLVGVDSRGLQQMQLVPTSFDAVLQSSASQETKATKRDDATDATVSQAARRLFTAA